MTKVWLAALLAFSGAVPIYGGTIIFDSTGDSKDGSTKISATVGPLYASFSTGANSGTLAALGLTLVDSSPADLGSITAILYSDASGAPGFILDALGSVADSSLSSTPTLAAVSLLANPTLTASTNYWIQLSTFGSGGWEFSNSPSGTGVANQNIEFNQALTPTSTTAFLMDVSVNGTTSAVPEPGTWSMMGVGVGLLLMSRKARQ